VIRRAAPTRAVCRWWQTEWGATRSTRRGRRCSACGPPLPTGVRARRTVLRAERNRATSAWWRLTFDDGPWPYPPTSQFLDVLERYHAVGHVSSRSAPRSTRMTRGAGWRSGCWADGDMIGNHTWSHPDMTRLDSSTQRVAAGSDLGRDQVGQRGSHLACGDPPYGAQNSGVVGAGTVAPAMITVNWGRGRG